MGNSQKNSRNSVLRLTKRPLGQILLDGGFISHSDLERALEQQKNTNELLGEILVNMGVLDPVDLKAVLSVNRDLASLEDAVKLAAGVRQLLGKLLLQARRITPQQLELALQEHQRTGEKLGEVLVRLGLITRSELDAVLTFQQLQETEAATSGRLKLGEILVTTNQISRDHLEDALSRQQLSKKKIGDLLVKAGYVQPYQLSHGLNLQNKLLKAALVAVLSLAPLSAVQAAEPVHQDASSVSSETKIAEEIQRHTALKVVHQTSELVITQADIIRGYIDIPAGANIEIQNNNLGGYMIFFKGIYTPFKEVLVKGLGGEVKINSNSGWITQPYNGRDPVMVELSYRFILSENAKPGTYAWPLTISVSPILPV
jgi:hypothetical protein